MRLGSSLFPFLTRFNTMFFFVFLVLPQSFHTRLPVSPFVELPVYLGSYQTQRHGFVPSRVCLSRATQALAVLPREFVALEHIVSHEGQDNIFCGSQLHAAISFLSILQLAASSAHRLTNGQIQPRRQHLVAHNRWSGGIATSESFSIRC